MKFVDTNVLVYLADRHDAGKREIAKGIIVDAMRNPEEYILGAQALAEFSNVCLRKFKMDADTVRDYLGFLSGLRIAPYTLKNVERALEVKTKYQLQFFDSLLLATAEANGCDTFLSEDLNSGQVYCGMIAVNPFDPDTKTPNE